MQLDMFGCVTDPPPRRMPTPLQPARPARTSVYPPAATPAWGRLLEKAGYELTPVFHVSTLWTGIVVESFHTRSAGHWILESDGRIRQLSNGYDTGWRLIYVSAAVALDWHAREGLVSMEPPSLTTGRYRLRQQGEAISMSLPLPAGKPLHA